MRQIGQIVYLAHIGSFVPAHSAQMSICESLYARMSSEASLTSQLSSFAHNMACLSTAIKLEIKIFV